jgi:hypothetical protein
MKTLSKMLYDYAEADRKIGFYKNEIVKLDELI